MVDRGSFQILAFISDLGFVEIIFQYSHLNSICQHSLSECFYVKIVTFISLAFSHEAFYFISVALQFVFLETLPIPKYHLSKYQIIYGEV